ncbi:MAG: tRNA glutamyl-Q(34) synthetase GluQRS [Alphaproteobacteria bacterium]
MTTAETTRFAPSPTNRLHLGHAYSAWFAWRAAGGGRFLLRIEDLDGLRCRPEFAAAILEDLAWLGFRWPEPVLRQSERLPVYRGALDQLLADGLAYPCFCSRKDIAREIAESGRAPHLDAMGAALYPGTCRSLPAEERTRRIESGAAYAVRLDSHAALMRHGPLSWFDRGTDRRVQVDIDALGDVVIARRDLPASYHLAVVVDDAAQGVTLVTRAEDLAPATHVHRLLQAALGLPEPAYHHHPLVADAQGRRLAKRDNPQTLAMLRTAGATPRQVWERLGIDHPPE